MAKHSRHIPNIVKEHLIRESGDKCSNPGCSNTRLQIHHIRHWAVYKTHDAEHMIALCPSCHDACHHGTLKISDETLHSWKAITRRSEQQYGHIYAEPGPCSKLLTGSICLARANKKKTTVFKFSENNKLEFSAIDNWLKVSTTITNQDGKPILKVTDNNLTLNKNKNISLTQRPGRFTITVPTRDYYLPAYAIVAMRRIDPEFGLGDEIIALDLEVLKPGLIRVQGFWAQDNSSVVITKQALHFCSPDNSPPMTLTGAGEDTVLIYTGSVDASIFGV